MVNNESEKTLIERRNKYVDEMGVMIKTAKIEKREFSYGESVRFKELKTLIDDIDEKLEVMKEERDIELGYKDKSVNGIPGLVLPGEKFETREKGKRLDLAKFVRGMSGKGWQGAEEEQRAFRALDSSTGSVVLPMSLASQIVDCARAESAILGKTRTVSMPYNNMTFAIQTADATASFVAEGDLIPTSTPIFSSETLTGKTLAIFVPVSEQLLDSTVTNLSGQLLNACGKAIANALDKALLYGEGPDKNAILGIANREDILHETVTDTSMSYDVLLKGIKQCRANNINPDSIAYSTNAAIDLVSLKDKDGQYITPPSALSSYRAIESNNVKDKDLFIFNSNSIILGIHKGITMEWGASEDMFRRIQKGLRIYLRADLGVLNTNGIAHISLTAE